MKRAAVVAAIALLTAAPLSSQSTSPGKTSSLGAAIGNTITNAAERFCANNPANPGCTASALQATVTKAAAQVLGLKNQDCPNTTVGCSWLHVMKNLLIPTGSVIGGGQWGGGGASGDWGEADCPEFGYNFDAQDNLIVPSVKLATSGPMPVDRVYYNNVDVISGGAIWNVWASKADATSLWAVHRVNLTRARYHDNWYGCYAKNSWNRWECANVAHYNGTTLVARSTMNPQEPSQNFMHAQYWRNGCPQGGQASGDFHFYYEFLSTDTMSCIWYTPNYQLSPSGYAYSPRTTIPASDVAIFPKRPAGAKPYPHLSNCRLAKPLIRALADKLYKKASEQPGYDGTPYEEVTNEDVETGGDQPTVDDLKEPQIPADLGDPTPYAEPTPTPTPTPSDGPDYSHVPIGANEPVAPEIDWWPDLPTVSLSFGSPACPTYDMSVPQFGWVATLDSHCPLIESNRALIATICMLMFSVGSILIVLRA